jgi:hypothetical protein
MEGGFKMGVPRSNLMTKKAGMNGYRHCAVGMVAMANCVSPVLASGQLPPSPMESRRFSSFAKCLAFLKDRYRADLKKADRRPIRVDDGSSQTLIDSLGVVATSPKIATYKVTEGWSFRRPDLKIRQIITSYSYETTFMRCDREELTGSSYKGYALEGFEDLPENWDPAK